MKFASIFSLISIVIFHVVISINETEIQISNLSCNFDDGTLCKWRSDSDLWLIGVDIPINSFQFIPHSSNTNGLYAYAKGGRAVLAEGHLISTEVEEYDERQATLSFTYWKSNNISKLDVCIAQQNAFICTYTAPDLIHKELRWIKEKIILSNNLSTPFKIIFRARNIFTSADIVAIDEIEYNNNSPKVLASLISRNVVLEKISSNKQAISNSCLPIQCTFINSSCAWTLGYPWHRLTGNIAIDGEGEGLVKSDFFMVPPEAFVEMDVWMSENALLTILENMENDLMIWNRKGLYNDDGWYRLRIPMKTSKQPVQLLIKGTVPTNNFITISNIKLVNNDGNEISCDVSTLNFIKSQFNNTERLTAFQQLHTNQIKPTTIIRKDRENESIRSLINNIIPAQNFIRRTSFTAPMINSNYTLASNSKFKEIRKLQLTNNKNGEFLKDQLGLSSKIINDPIKQQGQQQQHKLNLTSPLLPFREHDGLTPEFATFTQPLPEKFYAESDFSLGPIINQYRRTNASAKHSIMKELNTLLSQTDGQSVPGMQLRQLAQRFGLTGMNAEQSLELVKNFMNLKGLQSKIADGDDQEQNKKPEPIRPINAPPHFISGTQFLPHNGQLNSLLSLLPYELRKNFLGESKNLFG